MPNKYSEKKGWKVPKQKFKETYSSEYNKALRRRGDISVWLSDDAISQWNKPDRVYDGNGCPRIYTDFAMQKYTIDINPIGVTVSRALSHYYKHHKK